MKQTRRFVVLLTKKEKEDLRLDAQIQGVHYGIFFDTSGKAHKEIINPTAKYDYIFRTDEDV